MYITFIDLKAAIDLIKSAYKRVRPQLQLNGETP